VSATSQTYAEYAPQTMTSTSLSLSLKRTLHMNTWSTKVNGSSRQYWTGYVCLRPRSPWSNLILLSGLVGRLFTHLLANGVFSDGGAQCFCSTMALSSSLPSTPPTSFETGPVEPSPSSTSSEQRPTAWEQLSLDLTGSSESGKWPSSAGCLSRWMMRRSN